MVAKQISKQKALLKAPTVPTCGDMSHIVAICHIAVDMSRIAAICHIAINMSNWDKICPLKMKKFFLDKRCPITMGCYYDVRCGENHLK